MTISHSIFHRKIKNWIFLKSTQNGLLKNVQYGISRPLGSREIQKTKVATVLRDTLYNPVYPSLCNINIIIWHSGVENCPELIQEVGRLIVLLELGWEMQAVHLWQVAPPLSDVIFEHPY